MANVKNDKLIGLINGYNKVIQETGKLPPPLRANGNLSVKDLMDVIYYLMRIDKPEWNFAPAYPSYIKWNVATQRDFTIDQTTPTETFKPTITYRTVREMPAGFAGTGEPFSGYKNLNMILMEEKKFDDIDGPKVEQTKIKAYETLVQFELWDIQHENLDRMYEWFRRWLTLCRPLFKYMGIENCFYWGGGEFTNDQHLNKALNRRSMLYYVRTQELYTFIQTEILKEVKQTIEILNKEINNNH
ncbi:MAG: hypothetical protein IJ880_00310 [Bacilli bacterium]|nr:hypothetical protein [Bacilli bacterium]